MAGVYRPRHPERTVLCRVLFHHFDRFLTEYEGRFEKEYGHAGCRKGAEVHDPVNLLPGAATVLGTRGQGRLLMGLGCGRAGDLQHGPGAAVYERRVHGLSRSRRDPGIDGRPGPGVRQHLCRAILALGQVRRGLSSRISDGRRGPGPSRSVFSVLQRRAAARSARLSDAARGLLRELGHDGVGRGGRGLTWLSSRSLNLGQMVKAFFRRSREKWHLEKESDKMAITAGRHYTLLRTSRCPNYGIHPNSRRIKVQL